MSSKIKDVQAMESAAFSGDWDTFKSYLAKDVVYKVGNTADVRGPDAVVDYLQTLLSTQLAISGLETRGAFETEDTVVLEFDMKGTRFADKKEVAYPCIDVYRFTGGKISDWRVYAIEPTYVK